MDNIMKNYRLSGVPGSALPLSAILFILSCGIFVAGPVSAQTVTAATSATAASATTAATTGEQSAAYYQALGGKEGIHKIVKDFLPIVLEDPRIKDSFKDVDMERLSKMLQEQFCQLSGGPCTYSGKDMQTIHEDLKITNAQFNALAEDLQTAMDKNGVPTRAQNKLLSNLAPMQRRVVTR
jgi:hemoglobin